MLYRVLTSPTQAPPMPGMGWQFFLAVLVVIVSALFLLIFALVKIIRARVRRLAVPRWLWAWLAGLGLGILTVVILSSVSPAFFITLLYKYYRGWPPYLPLNMLSPVGMLLAFDLATLLWGLFSYGVLALASPKKA